MHEAVGAAAVAVPELPRKPLRQPGARRVPAARPALVRERAVGLEFGTELEEGLADDFRRVDADHACRADERHEGHPGRRGSVRRTLEEVRTCAQRRLPDLAVDALLKEALGTATSI